MSGRDRIKPTKEQLVDMYIDQHLSIATIGSVCKVRAESIATCMREYGIERRPKWGAGKVSKPSAECLTDLYMRQNLGIATISEQVGIGKNRLLQWMREYGIPIRPRYISIKHKARPSREDLVELYINQKLSTKQIASHLGHGHNSIPRWLRLYGIEIRQTGSNLTHRGWIPPTADELDRLIHEQHIPIKIIAEKYECSCQVIRRLTDRYGIERYGIRDTFYRGESPALLPPNEIETLITEGIPLSEISRTTGLSMGILRKTCIEHQIKYSASGWHGARYICSDGHEVKSSYEQRVDDWLSSHGIPHEYELPVPNGGKFKSDFFAQGKFIEVWGSGDPAYQEKKARKEAIYAAQGLRLVGISYHAFGKQSADKWKRILESEFIY